MFRSVFTKSLRDYRWGILGWGIGVGLLVFVYYGQVSQVLKGFSASALYQLAASADFFGEVSKETIGTPGGYVTYKIMGSMALILGIWTLLAGARMTRGEEERGAMDILLSTPQSRLGVLGQKVMALATAAGIVSVLIGLLTMAGMPSARVAVNPGAALLAGIDGGLGAFVFGALALFLAQLMSRGAAAGLTGGLMVFFFVLDGTGRAIPADAGIRWFSPFYYYDLNTPLIPGYVPNWGAFAVLVVISLVLVGASLPLFMRRDIGRSVLANMSLSQRRAKAAEPAGAVLAREERDVWVRGIGPQALRRQATESFWWIVSMALVAGFFVFFAKSAEQSFLKLLQSNSNSSLNGVIGKLFSGADITTNAGFLSALVFSYFMSLLVPVFGGVLAYHWATDLDRGRLELTLSTPPPRWRVVLERFGAVLASTVIATVVVWLAIVVCAQFAGFAVDEGRVAEATFGLLPLALITAALVYALASLIPPGAVIGIMTAFLAISYLAEVLQSFLKLPSWVLNLSMYHQYGAPLLSGLNWVAFVGMLVVAAALLALGVWQFTIRDLDRGAQSA
jgi:ABC-2 type transport system permease protein